MRTAPTLPKPAIPVVPKAAEARLCSLLPGIDAPLSAQLRQFEDDLINAVDGLSPAARRVITPVLQNGGKRLRPLLTFLAASFGSPAREPVRRLAVMVELVHTASLIHDDVIDRSETRRGLSTLHHSLGGGMAAASGAYMLHLACDIQRHLPDLDPDTLRELNKSVSRAASDLCKGQFQEILNVGNLAARPDDYMSVIEGKTAALFAMACRGGAIVTRGPAEALTSYGRLFGLLYQILDDLRDFLCSEFELGKAPGSDLRAGVYTLPVIYCLESDDEEGRTLRSILSDRRGRLSPSELQRALAALRCSSAVDKTLAIADEFGRAAREAIASLPRTRYRGYLDHLVGELLSRIRASAPRPRRDAS